MDVTAFVGNTRVPISAVDNGDGTFSLKTTGGGGGGSTVDRELVVTIYRAKAAGAGYSVGDTLTAVRYINVSTGTPAQEGATAWYNETTAATIAAPAAANIEVAGQPGLTDAQLRASAVPVSGPLTDAQLRNSPVPVSSQAALVRVGLTRPANVTAYAANDVLGDTGGSAIITFAAFGAAGDNIMLTSAAFRYDVAALPSGMAAMRLHLYTAAPTAIADNAAFDVPAGDRAAYVGWVDLAAPTDLGATLFTQVNQINKHVKLAGTALYGLLQTVGGFTPAANGEAFSVELGGVKL